MATSVVNLESLSPAQLLFLKRRLAERKSSSERKRILPAPRQGGLVEMSFAQERLWVMEQLAPGTPLYNMSGAAHVTGLFDPALWDRTLNEVLRRHEVLRATYCTVDGRPRACIASGPALRSKIVDLRQSAPDAVNAVLLEESRRPFDLASGPLLRSTLIRVADNECHVLLTMHHIVADGLSTSILFQECGAIYAALQARREPNLPPPDIQYFDYAYWQRQWLNESVIEAQTAYWKRQLEGMPHVLELPTERPRSAATGCSGARHSIRLGAKLTASLRDLSRREGVTLFVSLLAGYAIVLGRYAGQKDFAIGTPVAGRNWPETQNLIGCFLNTLALRADMRNEPTGRDLLGRLKGVVLGAFDNQELPIDKVLEALNVSRGTAPLFQNMFSLESNPAANFHVPGLKIEFSEYDTGTAKVDFTLELVEQRDELTGWLEYNSELFDAATAERFAGHFETVLEQLAQNPELPVSALRMLKRAELRRLTRDWNDTESPYPSRVPVHKLFEQQAAQTPNRLAVKYGERQFTYAELNAWANRLARGLRRHGVRTGDMVALCMDRSPEFIAGMLAILKAGGAFVPLDHGYPRQRLEFMLADTAATAALITREMAGKLPAFDGVAVLLEDLEDSGTTDLNSGVDAEDLAYVMYTSGSTGTPKGIGIPHRAIARLVLGTDYAQMREDDRVAQTSNVCFDAATFEVWGALLNGACLVGISKEIALSPVEFAAQLSEERITAMFLTTSLFNRMAAECPGAFAGLRHLMAGGEALDAQSVRRVVTNAGRPARFLNGYGPTESTTFAAWHEVAEVPPGAASVPIGRPLANTTLYVLDAAMEPVPVGVTGELYIGGDGLARGYINRPQLTAEKFVPDVFSERRGARLYRTGDLVRYREDGAIDYLGRTDDQVKIRGFRIEPGEIETLLRAHPAMRECAVMAREDQPGRKQIAAYVVTGEDASVAQLREWVRGRMPDYMVPAVWVPLEKLPLNANGKVDRRALPAPGGSRAGQEAAYAGAATGRQARLVEIWQSVLNVEKIGVNDNFFELGGDSILAIQAAARCNESGLAVSPAQMMRHQTIASLAEAVSEAPAARAEQGFLTGPVPLTPIQSWFFERLPADAHHWNQAVLLELTQPAAPDAVRQALMALVEHHDALRLRFRRIDGEWRQEIGADRSTSFFGEGRLADVNQVQASLDLSEGPILRAAYLRGEPWENPRLLIAVHHLAVDGVSWRILLEDLQTALRQLAQGEAIKLPPKTASFRQWSEKLREYAQSADLAGQVPYWLAQRNTEASGQTEANLAGSARTVSASLSAAETRALLQKAPQALRAQVEEILLAALALAFERSSLTVNLEGHGREPLSGEPLDLSRTVGWFTSISPVRLTLPAGGAQEALAAVKEQLRQRPERGVGYGVLRYLGAGLDPQSDPPVSFNYLGQFDGLLDSATSFRMAPESAGDLHSPRGERRHAIEINARVMGGHLSIDWTHNGDHDAIGNLAARMIGALRELLDFDAAAAAPSDFPLARLDAKKLDRVQKMLARAATKGPVQ